MYWWKIEFTKEGGIKSCEAVGGRSRTEDKLTCFVEAATKDRACVAAIDWRKRLNCICSNCGCHVTYDFPHNAPKRCKTCVRRAEEAELKAQATRNKQHVQIKKNRERIADQAEKELAQAKRLVLNAERRILAAGRPIPAPAPAPVAPARPAPATVAPARQSALPFTPENVLAAFDRLGPRAFREWLQAIIRQA